ncbi:MAG: metal-sulfur cluster assembly factor [Chloroflexota bacterium]
MTTDVMPAEDMIREALMEVIDPEIGVNIVDLGMVYGVKIEDDGGVEITMTLTTPARPLYEYIDAEVRQALSVVPGINPEKTSVNLVWKPPWNPSMMSEDAKLDLGFW